MILQPQTTHFLKRKRKKGVSGLLRVESTFWDGRAVFAEYAIGWLTVGSGVTTPTVFSHKNLRFSLISSARSRFPRLSGVTVSTPDSESGDPSSNLGSICILEKKVFCWGMHYVFLNLRVHHLQNIYFEGVSAMHM